MAIAASDLNAPFPDKGHNHRRCIDHALEEAEAACRRSDARLTDIRRQVLELVWQGHRPVGAYDILEALGRHGRKAQPPTVYRALEFLQRMGLVHRIETLNAFVGCSRPGLPHTSQFLICRGCGRSAEIEDRKIGSIIAAAAARSGFSVERQSIEAVGLCMECREAQPGTADA
ncbi:MAG: transcriptional repressor [Rhodospirillales bacterium]|nr:transcriptional repressor [Rhodospirillales bacterium]